MSSTQPKAPQQEPFKRITSNDKGSSELINQINTSNKTVDTTYLYTPTQYLISNFLTTKKNIEADLIQTLKGITQIRNKPTTSVNQLRDHLDMKKKQLQGIKRKLNKSCEQQIQVYDIMRKRIHRHHPESKVNHSKLEFNQQSKFKQETPSQSDQTKNNKITQPKAQGSALNCRKMFDLNLNKEVTYFMVEESVKIEQKLQVQQQKRIKKSTQDKKIKDQCQNLLSNIPDKNLNKQQKPQPKNNNGYQPLIQVEDGNFHSEEFVQSEMIEDEMRMIQDEEPQINMDDDLLDLERFFESEHFEMDYINSLRGLGKNMREMEKKLNQKAESEKSSKKEELWITEKDLFNENLFVQKLNKAGRVIENSRMDLEEPVKAQIQNNNNNQKDQDLNCFFEGQIQLECMLYRKKHQISNEILSNSLDSVNQFLYENSHMIKKYESDLEFWVVICRAIDLIKTKNQDKEMEAIQIMRNKLIKMKGEMKDWHRQQLQKVTSMLLMGNFSIATKPYLQRTEAAFRQVFQQIYRLPDFSRFLHSLYTGALILKTPTCIERDKENPLICPLCNPLAEKVFKGIPLLTRNQSNLICRIDGSVMGHENYPMMLPSNQIYSYKGLESTKKVIRPNVGKQIEQYYCKFTSTWYNKEQAKKVYLA